MMRAIAIAATVVMCAACAGQDQQSDGVGAPKATPAGSVDMLNKEINAALADPKPTPAAQGTDANVAGGPQPVTLEAQMPMRSAIHNPPRPLKAQIPMRSAIRSLCPIRSAQGSHTTKTKADIGTATELLGSTALTVDLHQSFCASPNRKSLGDLWKLPDIEQVN
jgi:hypothetical protein